MNFYIYLALACFLFFLMGVRTSVALIPKDVFYTLHTEPLLSFIAGLLIAIAMILLAIDSR